MSNLIQKIENKIRNQEKIPDFIQRIDDILKNNCHLLSDNEITELRNEKIRLEKKLIKSNLSIEKKFNDFFYSFEEIENAPEAQWLVSGVISSGTIGVFYGSPGCGKSSVLIYYCNQILKNFHNTYIIYIDADMALGKISDFGVGELVKQYGERFRYAGKSANNLSVVAQNLLKEIVQIQLDFPQRKYIIIEDSLTLITPRKQGFIDVEKLYRYEKQIRDANGTIIIVTHLNKAGVFADSQQIENYADYTFLVQRNDFNSSILLLPKKASRYNIHEKAYKVENRKIIEEIDFQIANISYSESSFVNTILDLLSDGEMNQSEIMKYLKQISFLSKYSIGEKKVLSLLDKWSKMGKWSCEQRVNEKNAKFYYMETAKLTKLPNIDKIGA
jgi:energy-coupling factor transporter ATP-binding protein EcfA2